MGVVNKFIKTYYFLPYTFPLLYSIIDYSFLEKVFRLKIIDTAPVHVKEKKLTHLRQKHTFLL